MNWNPIDQYSPFYVSKLADFYGNILVTMVGLRGRKTVNKVSVDYGRLYGRNLKGTPIAWMHLPEPYEGSY